MRVPFNADFSTLAWIPVILYFIVSKKPIPLAITLALQWFAGYPPLFILSLLLAMIFSFIQHGQRETMRIFFWGGLLSLGLVAIQLIPFIEMLHEMPS